MSDDVAPPRADLLASLERLDQALQRAAATARDAFDIPEHGAPLRGLYVSQPDVERLLAREPDVNPLAAAAAGRFAQGPLFDRLAGQFRLEQADLDILLIALAPDVDLKYETVYAYLQDDVTRKRPTLGLMQQLLGANRAQRLALRQRFAPGAPLMREGLLRLQAELPDASHSRLAVAVRVDEQVAAMLMDVAGPVASLARAACLVEPDDERDLPAHLARVLAAASRLERDTPLCLWCQGRARLDALTLAQRIARSRRAALLMVDLGHIAAPEAPELLGQAVREARLRGAVVWLEGFAATDLAQALGEHAVPVVLWSVRPGASPGEMPHDLTVVEVPEPGQERRRELWQLHATQVEIEPDPATLDHLAALFRLVPEEIAAAVDAAVASVRLGLPENVDAALFEAARAQGGRELGQLARRRRPRRSWNDLVLPDPVMAQLREICSRALNRDKVLDRWGFGERLATGLGVSVLFSGSPGTGKTLAAEAIATALQLDLYEVQLAGLVSKYIGETERNIDKVMNAAEHANAILFFDEADALFAKRVTDIRDSHDRYANIETSYLLQKMEQHDGITILATNLRGNLDEAFIRRLAFVVHFPLPDQGQRERIWERIWPEDVRRADDVTPKRLSQEYRLAGGNIRNVALAAAFLAAGDGGVVTLELIARAVQREFQKMGKELKEPV